MGLGWLILKWEWSGSVFVVWLVKVLFLVGSHNRCWNLVENQGNIRFFQVPYLLWVFIAILPLFFGWLINNFAFLNTYQFFFFWFFLRILCIYNVFVLKDGDWNFLTMWGFSVCLSSFLFLALTTYNYLIRVYPSMEIFPFGVSLFAFFHFFLSLITLNDLILKNQPFVVILDTDTTRDTVTRQLIN